MKNLELAIQFSSSIRSLARKAVKELSTSEPAYHEARRKALSPVNYARYPEFEAVLRELEISPQMTILDVSSPQWFSLYLADKNPAVEFHYINIIDSELDIYKKIANTLSIKNLKYQKADVRDLKFGSNTFDKVISISVIEHVYPEVGGDLKALNEILRVLKPKGDLLLTLPYKTTSDVVFMHGPVYERNGKTRNFYAREYDKKTLEKLIDDSKFTWKSLGLFARKRVFSQ